MFTFSNNNDSKTVNPSKILGAMGWFDETDFERGVTTIAQTATGFLTDAISIIPDVIGTESKDKTNGKLPSNGSIEFNKKQEEDSKKREEVDRKKIFFQALKEDADRAQKAKEKLLFEEEVNDIITNLPTDQKNRLLHYQASYRDRSIYQRAELRKKLIEEQNKQKEQKKQETIKSPAKQANAMDTAFEGGSGKSGTGSANFSSTGGGAG